MRQDSIFEELLLAADAPPETQLKVAGEDLLRKRSGEVHEEATEMLIQGETLRPLLLRPLHGRLEQGIDNFSAMLTSHDTIAVHRHASKSTRLPKRVPVMARTRDYSPPREPQADTYHWVVANAKSPGDHLGLP